MSPAGQARAQPGSGPSGRGRWAAGERVRCPLVCVGFVPVPGSRFPLPPSLAGLVWGSGGPPPVHAEAAEGGGFKAVAVFYDAEIDDLGGAVAAIDRFLQLAGRRQLLPTHRRPGGFASSSDPRQRTGCLCELRGPVAVGNEGHREYRLRAVAAVSLAGVCEAGGGLAAPGGEVAVEVSVLGEPGGQRLPPGALTDALHHCRRIWWYYDPERLAAALFKDVGSSLALSGVIVPPWLLQHPSDLSYWVLRNISFRDQQDDVQWVFDAPNVPERLRRCLVLVRRDYSCHKSQDSVICCGVCKVPLSTVSELILVSESETEVTGRFINPHGVNHEIVSVGRADVEVVGEGPIEEDSWFPGYAWECVCCAVCRHHVGWRFTSVEAAARRTFFGLRRAAIAAHQGNITHT